MQNKISNSELSDCVDSALTEQLEFLKSIVEINSYSHNTEGVNAVQDLLQAELERMSFQCERLPAPGLGDHLVGRTNSLNNNYLLVGHSDTVALSDPGDTSFRSDATHVFGPGTMDMKGGLVVMLWALKAVAKSVSLSSLPLTVFVLSDEEVGSTSSLDTINSVAEGSIGALVFEAEREDRTILTSRKGVDWYEVEISGKNAHAGNDHQDGINAVEVAAQITSRLHSLTDYNTDRTFNVGCIQGGTAVNVVPDQAALSFEVRSTNPEDFELTASVLEELIANPPIQGCRISVKKLISIPPMTECKESIALAQAYQKASEAVGVETKISETAASGGSTANYLSAQGIPSLDALGPYGRFDHSPDECAEIESIKNRTLAAARFILNLS